MNENTKNKFAEILKAAQDKANIQKVTVKPEIKPEHIAPAPISEPVKEETKQELSSITIADLLNEPVINQEPNKPNLRLIDYSDKAFAVIGDTKPIKEQLRQLGGRFNMYLTCGAGWIYPKTKAYTVRKALNLI